MVDLCRLQGAAMRFQNPMLVARASIQSATPHLPTPKPKPCNLNPTAPKAQNSQKWRRGGGGGLKLLGSALELGPTP